MLVLGGSFAILLVLVRNGQADAFDFALRKLAIGYNTPTTVAIWEYISFLGSLAFLIGLTFLIIAMFAIRRDWLAVRHISFAMSGAVGLNIIAKWIVHRVRPDELYAHTMPASYSFPSGHALYSLTFYLTIAMILGRRSQGNQSKAIFGAAVVLLALIGTSRIFLGVHYGSDVLGGYLIAAVWLLFLSIPSASKRSHRRHGSLL